MEDREIFICSCGSIEHQAIFWYDNDEKTLEVNFHLCNYDNFFKKCWIAIKYVFGYKSKYGNWDSFIFKPSDEDKLKKYLNKTELTFKEQLDMEIIPKIINMLDSEKEHLSYLKRQKETEMISKFISESKKSIYYLENKYKEYSDYSKTIK